MKIATISCFAGMFFNMGFTVIWRDKEWLIGIPILVVTFLIQVYSHVREEKLRNL